MILRMPLARPAWIILGSALAVSLVATLVVVRADARETVAKHHALATSLSHQLARASHLALISGNRGELVEIARSVLHTDPVIGSVTVLGPNNRALVTLTREPPRPGALPRVAAAIAATVSGTDLPSYYSARFPPAEDLPVSESLDTPQESGRAVLMLSSGHRVTELAGALLYASLLGMFVFFGLAATGFAAAWTSGRPLSLLGQRLRDLSGTEARALQADLEYSLDAIGQRLSRSEDRARRAAQALRTREVQLDRAREHAHDATRLRADLVAGMSHELRTPLTAILGHAELLSRGDLDSEQRDQVATVQKSARNLLGVINDVLEWSGLEAGRTSINEVGFNLAETVEDTVTLLAPLAFEKDLELVHLIYQDVPLRLRGDPLRFQQILTNLVSNAIKFTDSGGVVVRIMLEDEDSDAVRLRVSVADTGPGISAEDCKRLFAMYERLESDRRSTSGSGLGLAICKRLLEMMGGHIDVDSQPGQGSDFYFVLPLKKALHREQRLIPWSGLSDKRIWLAEDHAPARKAFVHHLESWHILTVELDTLADLHACLDDEHSPLPRPDAVVIGLRTADVDNPDLGAVLTRAATSGIPVLALVTSIDNDLHTRLEEAGAGRSLPKSINRLRLYRELCELTGANTLESATDSQPLAGVQALVADDNAASRRYVAALLTGLGAGVAVAADGKEAVAAWRKGAFPLVFLDDQMPEMDGVTATEKIRGMASEEARPVLIGVTADATGDAPQRFLAAGADECLAKPFDENQILRRIPPLLKRASDSEVSARSGGHSERLAADPHMAAMLARELPEQLAAVEAALAAGDLGAGQREIHALHGTAAFYGLDQLKTESGVVEQTLQAGGLPTRAAADRLRVAAEVAMMELERRAAATPEGGKAGAEGSGQWTVDSGQ